MQISQGSLHQSRKGPEALLQEDFIIQGFSEVSGYKINAQKSVMLLYINNVSEEREIKEMVPLTTAPKSLRYLGIHLT